MSPFFVGVVVGIGIGIAIGAIAAAVPLVARLEEARDQAHRMLRDAENVAQRARRGGL